MIGDWVSYGGTPIKVENVHGDCINFQHDIPFVQEEFMIEYTKIKPIPLTPEILEKNGFKGECYLILELDEFSYLEYYPFEGRLRKIWHGIDEWNNHSDTKDITFQCHCKYVHELQHALRLCGMNELADNCEI